MDRPLLIAARRLLLKRMFSARPCAIPEECVINDIENNVHKPRNHPGIMTPRTVLIPESFIKAVINATEDYPLKALLEGGEKLGRHLNGRVPPLEKEEIKERIQSIQQKVLSRCDNLSINSKDDEHRFKQRVHDKVKKIVSEQIYNWKPIKYDVYNSLLYLLNRSAAEYAVLVKILGEIELRDKGFKPRSLFDFGSGVGTATWAANTYWKQNIFEYFNVDISRDMNDLAQTLLQGGKFTGKQNMKGVFHRQFLPATKVTYDLVFSAYSMLELPSLQARLETALNLWNKTEKYLIIVEQGTNAGFKIVNEIRDFILQIDKEPNVGTVFSPCPHDDTCPRFVLDDGTPCNFEVTYFSLPVGASSESRKELYSYVVLKKGRPEEINQRWPRLVRPTLVRSKHSICRMCSARGKLGEVIFTASKHGKSMYHCARASKWGDLLPVKIQDTVEDVDCDTTDQN
ncbi:ribosome assembly protein METTL17, mitochondrial [Leptinotarsa decemlineata]|uniref:ribosome assembly protein METTL17, mitochondrial n=1 Tax=Leptinotarsa decemlineata TaxID=7539 RepID=UPI003D30A4A0